MTCLGGSYRSIWFLFCGTLTKSSMHVNCSTQTQHASKMVVTCLMTRQNIAVIFLSFQLNCRSSFDITTYNFFMSCLVKMLVLKKTRRFNYPVSSTSAHGFNVLLISWLIVWLKITRSIVNKRSKVHSLSQTSL